MRIFSNDKDNMINIKKIYALIVVFVIMTLLQACITVEKERKEENNSISEKSTEISKPNKKNQQDLDETTEVSDEEMKESIRELREEVNSKYGDFDIDVKAIIDTMNQIKNDYDLTDIESLFGSEYSSCRNGYAQFVKVVVSDF